jgi:hypothetical protein
MFTYFAGVDNIEIGQTSTSDSLFSIYIVEGSTEVTYWDESGNERIKVEGDNIVASWTGRYDDIDDTNKQAELLIRMYNAFTLCERNKPNFITHMIKANLRHLLATTKDVPLFKEASEVVDPTNNIEIGIYMDSTGNKQNIADEYLIKWLKTPIKVFQKKDSEGNLTEEVVHIKTKIDNIEDYYLLEELRNERENTDRRDALRLAILLKTMQQAINRTGKRTDTTNRPTEQKAQKITRRINFLGNNNPVNYTRKTKIKYIG